MKKYFAKFFPVQTKHELAASRLWAWQPRKANRDNGREASGIREGPEAHAATTRLHLPQLLLCMPPSAGSLPRQAA